MDHHKYSGIIDINDNSLSDFLLNVKGNRTPFNLISDKFYLTNRHMIAFKSNQYLLVLDGIVYEFDHQPFSKGQYPELVMHLAKDFKQALTLMNGEFTIILVDLLTSEKIIATSETGNVAFYYRKTKNHLLFGNSITEIVNTGKPDNLIHFERIYDLLTGSNLGSEKSCYTGINRLLPGYCLHIKNECISIVEYSKLFTKGAKTKIDKEPYEQFRKLFYISLKRRLLSNKIGCALSSGKDSTAVTSMALSALSGNQKLFGYTFKPTLLPLELQSEFKYNETLLLESFYKRYPQLNKREIELEPGFFFDSLEKSIEIYGEPVYGSSNQFWIQEMHSLLKEDGCKSLLTGQGGNYTISWPPPELVSRKKKLTKRIIQRYFPYTGKDKLLPYVNVDFSAQFRRNNLLSTKGFLKITEMQKVFLKNNISYSGCLQKQASLYHNIHITDPTVDKNLVEFCLSLPYKFYHDRSGSRKLVTHGMIDLLPKEIITNTTRGIQAADIHLRFHSERSLILEKLKFLNTKKMVTFVFDIDKLIADWIHFDFYKMKKTELNHLSRVLLIGLFLSKNED